MEPITIFVAALAAVGVLLIFVSLAGGSDVNARLERYASATPADQSGEPKRDLGERISTSAALASFNRVVERRDWGSNLARELARADLALKPSEFLAIRVGAMVGVPLLMIILSPIVGFFSSPLTWIVGFLVGYWLPRFWLNRRKSKRLKAFNSNLADTIMLLANSLRAGSSFLQALEMIVRETQPPISTEFGRVIREVNLGLPLDEALANLGRRVRSDDLDLMTTAIGIHHTVGGNLAEILDSIAYTIRERVRIKGEIGVLTAQQAISGYVISAMPPVLAGILFLINPGYLMQIFVWPWICMPIASVVLIVSGFFAMKKITAIEV